MPASRTTPLPKRSISICASCVARPCPSDSVKAALILWASTTSAAICRTSSTSTELVEPGVFNLLLSHNPDVFPVAARQGFDLTLAGHTHGGQINLEIAGSNLNIADVTTPYTKGFYQLTNSSLYVNSGLGTIGVPVRIGAPPEITLIRLCDSSS